MIDLLNINDKSEGNMSKLLLIVLVQLLYVPMLTLRTISMVKNLKVFTAFFGFMEALIYIFGLVIVLSGEQTVLEMVVYAIGFALGLIVGIYVEQKLAIGFISMQVTISDDNQEMIIFLREQGFGVTIFRGEGKYANRVRLDILTKRKRETELINAIYRYEPSAFIVAYEPKTFKGGYLTEIMRKRVAKRLSFGINKADSESSAFEKAVDEIKYEIKVIRTHWKQ